MDLMLADKTEIQYFNELQNSSHEAFDYFFDKYYLALFAYANKMISDGYISEEIVQGMFMELWENKSRINIHTSVKSYLFRSVHNDCIDFIKRSNNGHKIRFEKLHDIHEPNVEFYDTLIESDFEKVMEKMFSELPEQCRIIFFLNRFDGLSYKEIALKQNLSIKTVENQIGKALKLIREKLQSYF